MSADQHPKTASISKPAGTPLRVLLVDDQREICKASAMYMRYQGFDVTEAEDGRAALEAVRTLPRFDFALLDISLPDIDGREVAVQLREASPTTWIALVTGWTLDPDEPLPSEIDGVFIKPVSLGDLCRILAAGPKPGANRSA
jgi:DNA-binding response OmpR family regulator